jgi:hypothetical protein
VVDDGGARPFTTTLTVVAALALLFAAPCCGRVGAVAGAVRRPLAPVVTPLRLLLVASMTRRRRDDRRALQGAGPTCPVAANRAAAPRPARDRNPHRRTRWARGRGRRDRDRADRDGAGRAAIAPARAADPGGRPRSVRRSRAHRSRSSPLRRSRMQGRRRRSPWRLPAVQAGAGTRQPPRRSRSFSPCPGGATECHGERPRLVLTHGRTGIGRNQAVMKPT